MWTRGSRVGWYLTVALAASMFAAAGCETGPYLSAYSYQPHPGIYEVRKHGAEQQAPPLTAMVNIVGVRRADKDRHVEPSVDVRFQFQSNGSESITFDPSTLELATGSLRPFPRPYVSPPATIELSSGQHQNVSATFPFPPNTAPEQLDLNELRLRWVVHVAGYAVPQTALFERVDSGAGGDYEPMAAPQSDVAY